MTYAARADLETRFGEEEISQLTDRPGSAESTPDEIIAAALADTDVEIDAYLAVGYDLPLASTPQLIVRLACDIARYRLWKDQAAEQVRRAYEDAVDLLKRIAAGKVKLTIDGAVPAGDGAIQTPDRCLAFGHSFEEAYLPRRPHHRRHGWCDGL